MNTREAYRNSKTADGRLHSRVNFTDEEARAIVEEAHRLFHYSSTQDYEPEFTSMNRPNLDARAAELLKKEYGAQPAAMQDVILLAPRDKISERREQYPSIPIYPLAFSSSELQAAHWKFLMGAVGNQATYIRQMNQLMRSMRSNLTLGGVRARNL